MTRGEEESQVPAAAESPGLMARIKAIGGLVAVGALGLFLLQNLQEVDVNFLWFSWSTRMLWALLVAALVGGVAALLFGTLVRRRWE